MFVRRFVELLTPSQCLQCGRDGAVLCTTCVAECALDKPVVCYRCGISADLGETCAKCLEKTVLEGVSVGALYGGAVKELVLQLKFHRVRAAARVAVELVTSALPENLKVDVVVAVPISAQRYRERGYNQSELIAREMAKRLRISYLPVLGRVNSEHQIGRDRLTRLRQIKGAFYVRRPVDGLRLLVVDDVVTTGATLSECAEVLTCSGAASVWGAVVARH